MKHWCKKVGLLVTFLAVLFSCGEDPLGLTTEAVSIFLRENYPKFQFSPIPKTLVSSRDSLTFKLSYSNEDQDAVDFQLLKDYIEIKTVSGDASCEVSQVEAEVEEVAVEENVEASNETLARNATTSVRMIRGTYFVTSSNCTGNGEVKFAISEKFWSQFAGRIESPGDFVSNKLTVDNLGPAIEISEPETLVYNQSGTVSFTLSFSDENGLNETTPPVISSANLRLIADEGVSCGDLAIAPLSGNTYQVTVSGCTGDGGVQLSLVSSDAVVDAVGNANQSKDSISVTIDNSSPAVAVGSPTATTITSQDTVTIPVTYSDLIALGNIQLSSDKISLTKTGSATCNSITVNNSTTSTPTVQLGNCRGAGTIALSISAGTASDSAGNSDSGSSLSTTFTIETLPCLSSSQPAAPSNASWSKTSTSDGADVTGSCNFGYTGTITPLTCTDGTWGGGGGSCELVSCTSATQPAALSNASWASTQSAHGRTVSGSCNYGYTGSINALTCTNGTWGGGSGSCSLTPCTSATQTAAPSNASWASSSSVHGSTVTGSCNLGYSGTITSLSCTNGTWSGGGGTCVAGTLSAVDSTGSALTSHAFGNVGVSETFKATPYSTTNTYRLKIPAISSMQVKAWGAGGGGKNSSKGGGGGYSTATVNVTEGDNYSILVGAGGGWANGAVGGGSGGGQGQAFGGGRGANAAASSSYDGGGGGQASAVWKGTTVSSTIGDYAAIAGGGGGAALHGVPGASYGGAGGGVNGVDARRPSGSLPELGKGAQGSVGGLAVYQANASCTAGSEATTCTAYSSSTNTAGSNFGANPTGIGSDAFTHWGGNFNYSWGGGGGGGGYAGGSGGNALAGGGGSSYYATGGSTTAGSDDTAGNSTDSDYVALGTSPGKGGVADSDDGNPGLVVIYMTSAGSQPTKSFFFKNASPSVASGCSSPSLGGSSNFTISTDNCGTNNLSNVSGSNSCEVIVKATPQSVGAKSATLSRTCTTGGTVSVSLSTTGVQSSVALTPASNNYGSVASGTLSGEVTFTFTNSGTTSATGCEAPIINSATSDFVISEDNCGTNDLPASGSNTCTVKVKANPQSTGAKSGSLSRFCAEGGYRRADLSVTGT